MNMFVSIDFDETECAAIQWNQLNPLLGWGYSKATYPTILIDTQLLPTVHTEHKIKFKMGYTLH